MSEIRLERRSLALCLLAFCLALPLSAQTPQPAGPSVQVNTLQSGSVSDARIAWRCDADITMIVWSGLSTGSDPDGSIQARFFAGTRPTGPQRQVNLTTLGVQQLPKVRALDNGDFAVAWLTPLETQLFSVRLRTFDRVTLAPTAEQIVGPALAGNPGDFDFTIAADGRVAIAWYEEPNVFGQVYDLNGQPDGPELSAEVLPFVKDNRLDVKPRLTLGPGDSVLEWFTEEEVDPKDFATSISWRYQRFLPDGSESGPEVRVAGGGVGCQFSCGSNLFDPISHVNQQGEFIATYTSYSYDFGTTGLDAKRFSPDGEETLDFPIFGTFGGIGNQAIAGEADGDFLVVWNFSAEYYSADATDLNPPSFDITDNKTGSSLGKVDVTYNGPGSPFAAVWTTSGQVRWRRFLSFPGMLVDGFESGDTSRWCVARSAQ